MRTLASAATTAMAGGGVGVVQLLAFDFNTTPIYLNTSNWDLTWQRRVNLLTYSEQMNLGWGSANCVITTNQTADPNGVVSAEKLAAAVAGGVSTDHYIDKTLTGTYTLGDFYTQSVYVKAAEETTVTLRAYYAANGGSGRFTFFNLTTKTVTSTNATRSGIVDVGGGWLRCWQTVVVDTVETRLLSRILMRGSQFIGDGVSGLYIWGFQLENSGGLGPYTPTTTVAINDPGVVYKGAYGLGNVSAVTDKPGEVTGITLELISGDSGTISLALDDSDVVQGTPLTIRTAIIDLTTYTILDAPVEWVGTLDTMVIAEDGTQCSIRVTAESKAVDLLRGSPMMYSDADQKTVNATDGFFKYVIDQLDKPITWPQKAFFYA